MTNRTDIVHEVLRHLLAAVKQHFIHVLILEARGDKTSAAEITGIDNSDLPVAMQMIEHLVLQPDAPNLCTTNDALVQTMPFPGFTDAQICYAEQQMERRIQPALEHCLREKQDPIIQSLARASLCPRAAYAGWLTQWKTGLCSDITAHQPLTQEQKQCLNMLFANMMVVIDQFLIHAFVYRTGGHTQLADCAWEISGAAMMRATAMTKLLAARGLVADPASAVRTSGAVALPVVSNEVGAAVLLDKALALWCSKIGADGCAALVGTEFHKEAASIQSYFQSASQIEGVILPRIPNPCRDFERTLGLYVHPEQSGDRA